MTEALSHRGPDGDGYYSDSLIALGHKRLSIIDLAGGAQPIANEDETVYLVCNGEIYNSPGLREDLKNKGHRFRTATDVEVILHLYEEHGADCVKFLRGMFAFAIWDTAKQQLLLARDHMGQKPLFFYSDDNCFLFASEIKALFASGLVEPQIDLEGIWHYVSLRYLPDDYTLFRNVKKLQSATTLEWSRGGFKQRRYWQPDFNTKSADSEAQLEEKLDAMLTETVRMHTLSDVPVGAFLSGGIDSSIVASIMARNSSAPVPCFSIGVEDQEFNELPFARLVAKKYGMDLHERIVEPDLIHLLPSMVRHMEEPVDPFGFGVYLVSELASKHVKVALTGDGGDENYAGYDRYAGQRMVDYYAILPEPIRRHLMRRIIKWVPDSYGYNSVAQKATWLNELSFFERGERYAHSLCFLRYTPEAKQGLFTDSARSQIEDRDSYAKVLQYFDADCASDLIDKMLYTDLMTRMPDHLLALGDRMSMAHSLEIRPTLVDHEFVEFSAAIPAQLKLRGTKLKYLLKKAAARHIPKELITRKKQGFSFPIGRWLQNELRDFAKNLFSASRMVEVGVFDQSYIQEMLDEHIEGRADHNYRLWIIINLELWYRMFIEGWSEDDLREMIDEFMVAGRRADWSHSLGRQANG